MNDIIRIKSSSRSSKAVVYNGLVFVGGQTADDRKPGIEGQTQQVLTKIDTLLADAGVDKSRVLSAQVWLKDVERDFAGMNGVWDAWTAPGAAPARATAQCPMALPEILVEIVVTAAAAKSPAAVP